MPKFNMNDKVMMDVAFKSDNGMEVTKPVEFIVVGIRRTSTTTEVTYEYDLSTDPCQPYYAGKVDFKNVKEGKISAKV